jgi:hypothetical protein
MLPGQGSSWSQLEYESINHQDESRGEATLRVLGTTRLRGLGNAIRLSFSVRGNVLTLIDGGPTMFNEHELHYRGIALRYNASKRFWSLYHVDRHGKWHQNECKEQTQNKRYKLV